MTPSFTPSNPQLCSACGLRPLQPHLTVWRDCYGLYVCQFCREPGDTPCPPGTRETEPEQTAPPPAPKPSPRKLWRKADSALLRAQGPTMTAKEFSALVGLSTPVVYSWAKRLGVRLKPDALYRNWKGNKFGRLVGTQKSKGA